MSISDDFSDIRFWIFDLDNTLYPPSCGLFGQVDRRMGEFIAALLDIGLDEARRLQKHYYRHYGTTLRGLMTEHGVAPAVFLDYVHDIDHSLVAPDPLLRGAIAALPGRRYVLTNGSRSHAETVAGRLGIGDLFDDVFDIEAAAYTPKPARDSYLRFIAASGCDPACSAIFEDLGRNLEIPHDLGMRTVLVTDRAQHQGPFAAVPAPAAALPVHIDHVTDDLASFLTQLTAAPGSRAPGGLDSSGVADIVPRRHGLAERSE